MANHRYTNTVAAAAMSLGLDPDFLHDSLDGLRNASDKYKEVKPKYASLEIAIYGRFAMNEEAKHITNVIKPLGPHERRD